MSATSCYRHPQVSATRSCGECFQPICAGCAVIDGERCRCPDCAASHQKGQRRQRVVGLALGLVVLLGVGGYVAWRASAAPSSSQPSFDYGDKSAVVEAHRHQLEKEPCDRTRAVQYAQVLFSAEDWRGCLRFADDFVARCGKFPALRSITYSAHMRLSEFDLAIQDATELVDSAPGNAGYRVWRALAFQSKGAAEQSLKDLEEAFRLQPEQVQVASQLANAYEQQRRPCEALDVLHKHLRLNPDSQRRPDLQERYLLLREQGNCRVGDTVTAPADKPGKR